MARQVAAHRGAHDARLPERSRRSVPAINSPKIESYSRLVENVDRVVPVEGDAAHVVELRRSFTGTTGASRHAPGGSERHQLTRLAVVHVDVAFVVDHEPEDAAENGLFGRRISPEQLLELETKRL